MIAKRGIAIKILVTGGYGFIGKKLVNVLNQNKHEVTVLSRRKNTCFFEGVRIINGDLTSLDCPFDNLLNNCDVVFHCAAEIHNEEIMQELHVAGTHRLMDAVLNEARKSKKIIHWVQLSSVGVYGLSLKAANEKRIVTEKTAKNPKGVYEVTKALSDDLVIKASRTELVTYTILRPSIVFGVDMPNQSIQALGRMIASRRFFYIGKPDAVATYIHVDDVVNALLHCGTDSRAKNMIFNISNDCLQQDMINSIANTLNVENPKIRLPESFVRYIVRILPKFINSPLTCSRINALVSRTYYSNSLIKSTLSLSPKIDVSEAIKELF